MSIECQICHDVIANNLGGQFTNHLKTVHSSSLEEYAILANFGGVSPVCKCGLCEERPVFYRGKFQQYAFGHDSFEKRAEMYVSKFGIPKCLTCGVDVGFKRGKPNQYCSHTCSGKQHGFSKASTQNRIREVVREKHGVCNISQISSVKEAISKSSAGRKTYVSDETKAKHSLNLSAKWANPDARLKMTLAIKQAVNKPEERKRRSDFQRKQMNDPVYVEKLFGTCWGKFSKLHQRLREYLELGRFGFVSEQIIGSRLVDELHPLKKIVIEINGDYIHANPKKYAPTDVIRIPGESYTAQEKWDRDQRKIDYLQSKGYEVYVVWESDDIEEWKTTLAKRLE
jgi:G:T-mismatch repair DNA endonuclease (very short patch repair protein)